MLTAKKITKFLKPRYSKVIESEDTIRRKRMLWSSRKRGRVETELFFGSFATEYIWKLDEKELNEFEAILEETDYDLYNWVLNLKPVPKEYQTVFFERIKSYVFSKSLHKDRIQHKAYDFDYDNTDNVPPSERQRIEK